MSNNSPLGHYNAWQVGPRHPSEIAEEEALMQRIIQEQIAAQTAAANAAAAVGAGGTPPYTFFNPIAPAAPSNASSSWVSGTLSVRLTWTDNSSDEDGFTIQRATNFGAYSTASTVAANTTLFVDSAVVSGSTYSYRVYSFKQNASTAQPVSSSVSVTSSIVVNSGSVV